MPTDRHTFSRSAIVASHVAPLPHPDTPEGIAARSTPTDWPDALTVNERAAAGIVLDVLGLGHRPTLRGPALAPCDTCAMLVPHLDGTLDRCVGCCTLRAAGFADRVAIGASAPEALAACGLDPIEAARIWRACRPTLAETLAANSAPNVVRARRSERERLELSTRRDRAVAALRELAIATEHSARIANGAATEDDMRATLRMVCGIRAGMIADVEIGDDRIFLYTQARDALGALLAAVAS